jgi:hypothetical protein
MEWVIGSLHGLFAEIRQLDQQAVNLVPN